VARETLEGYSTSLSQGALFQAVQRFLRNVYLRTELANLSVLNQFLIKTIATDFLGIRTEFVDSRHSAREKKLGRSSSY
jgi:hypothetical protein